MTEMTGIKNRFSPNLRRGLALFVYGLIFVGLLLITLRLSTGKAAQTEWRTFTEPGLGYQIDYPAGWVPRLVADNTQRKFDAGVALRSVGFFGPNSQIVFVDVWENANNLSLSEWAAKYPSPAAQDANFRQSKSVGQLNGAPALRFQSEPLTPLPVPQSPAHYRTQFLQGNLVIAIEYVALQPDLPVYRAMLKSYRPVTPTLSRRAPSQLSGDNPPASYGVQTAACCGYTDPEYNPFPCNTAGDDSCPYPPCGNCTWWVRYKRQGGAAANLDRCTGDADTWLNCAQAYYPAYLGPYPSQEAVVLYPGVNHVSFVENVGDNTAYSYSDLSWYNSCPANYGNSSAGGGKQFIANPEIYVPNEPPNAPELDFPGDGDWIDTRSPTLDWTDKGDPDDAPYALTFLAEIENDAGWMKNSGWRSTTEWEVTLPAEGEYTWRVKASDGADETWAVRQKFKVDSQAPAIAFTAYPAAGEWRNTDAALAWRVSDAAPSSGVDYFKWAWDDASPDNKVNADEGSTLLSVAGQGQHTLYVRGWDKAGNASKTASLGWVGYDTVAPVLSFDPANPQPQRWYNAPQTLAWSLSDPAPGSGARRAVYFWLDDEQPESAILGASGQIPLPILQGQHSVEVYANDVAGNASPAQQQGWFGYDSLAPAPPSITITCAISNNWPQNTCLAPTFRWQSSDPDAPNASGIAAYAFTWTYTAAIAADWAAVWTQTTVFTPANLPAGGDYTAFLHVAAKDNAGNIGAPGTFALRYASGGTVAFPPPDAPEDFRVAINNNILFTNNFTVTVSANAPGVISAAFSASSADLTRVWQPTPLTRTWIFTPAADNAPPRRIYAWFQDERGGEYGPYFDDIIYDPNYPRGSAQITNSPTLSTRQLSLFAWDDSSGVDAMRLGTWETVTKSVGLPDTRTAVYTAAAASPVVYAQFRDRAGNLSPIYGTDGSDSSMRYTYLPLVLR